MTDLTSDPLSLMAEKRKAWYVLYVNARHEKRASSELNEKGLESYLPMRKELHQWSDRKKWVEVPLFTSYVFVRAIPHEFNGIYTVSGFVKFVSQNGKPSIIPDKQVEDIRRVVEYYSGDVEVLDGSYRGYRAEVTAGPLAGLRGEIIEVLNQKNFVIRIEGLEKLLSVNVPAAAVKLLDKIAGGGASYRSVSEAGLTSATS